MGSRLGCRGSVSGDGDDDFPVARFDIAFDVKNLLPGSEDETAVSDGNGEAGSHEGRL